MSQQNRTKMSVTQLTLLTAINMMGSGIVMLPTKLAEIGTFYSFLAHHCRGLLVFSLCLCQVRHV